MQLPIVFEYIDKATEPLRKTEQSVGSLQRSVGTTAARFKKFTQVTGDLGKMGDTMGKLMNPGLEFEQAMADLGAATGIAGADLDLLGRKARETGIKSGFGAAAAAKAFTLLASQVDVSKVGMDGLMQLQNQTLTLAQAGGISLEEAARGISATINQFGLPASEAGRVINVLAAGGRFGAAGISQLAESFGTAGSAAAAAGLSVEQTAGAVEVLAGNNLRGAAAGTALSTIVQKMQTALGTDFRQTSLDQALVQLTPHLQDAAYMTSVFGEDNVDTARYLIANADKVREMTARVTDTSTAQEQAAIRTDTWAQKIRRHTAQFNDWGISLQQSFGGLMYGLQLVGQGGKLLSNLAPAAKHIFGLGDEADKAGAKFVRFFRSRSASPAARRPGRTFAGSTPAAPRQSGGLFRPARALAPARKMGRLPGGGTGAWTGTLQKAGSAQGGFMKTLRSLGSAMRSSVMPAFRNGAAAIGSWIGGVGAAGLQVWSKALKMASVVQGGFMKMLRGFRSVMLTSVLPALMGAISATWAWTVALLANPITWIVVGIAALVTAVVLCWQKFAAFRAVVLTIWDTIKGFGMAIFNFLVTPWKMAWEIVSGMGRAIYKLFTGDFAGAAEEFTGAFANSWDTGTESVKESINGVKDTAAGVGGNFEAHLTEEQVKQDEKEKKEEKTAGTGNINPGLADINLPSENFSGTVQPQIGRGDPAGSVTPYTSAAGGEGSPANPPATPGEFVIVPAPEVGSIIGTILSGDPQQPATLAEPSPEGLRQPAPPENPDFAATPGPSVINVAGPAEVRTSAVTAPASVLPGFPPLAARPEGSAVAQMPRITRPQSAAQVPPEKLGQQLGILNSRPGAGAATTAAAQQPARTEIRFQPVINISAEITQKSREDLLSVLRGFGGELARIIEEQQRRERRADYAVS